MSRREDIKLVLSLRDKALKKRERYKQLLANPVNRRTGNPLEPSTIKSYRSIISQCTMRIELYDKEIAHLSALAESFPKPIEA